MNKKYMEMHLAVDRYLRGGLSGSEVAEFEERLTWDQELLDELEIAERLRDGLREEAAEPREAVSSLRTRIAEWLSNLYYVPQTAAALSFALAVALTAGFLLGPLGAGRIPDGFQATRTEIVPLVAVRGAAAQSVEFDASSQLVLLVDVTGSHDAYRVSVRADRPGASAIWMQDDMRPTHLESLAVGMPGHLLGAGPYVLSVEGVSTSGDGGKVYEYIQDIPFVSAPVE